MLNVLGVPLRRSGGGVEQQFMARLRVEGSRRPTACLVRGHAAWILEVTAATHHLRVDFADQGRPTEESLELALRGALEATAARLVHVENPAGLALQVLTECVAAATPLVLSVHDFSLFCPRPYLRPALPVGGCARDGDSGCALCRLEPDAGGEFDDSRARRARDLLDRARAVVFPSEFLRAQYRTRLNWNGDTRTRLVQPAIDLPPAKPWRGGESIRHVASVGSVRSDKGGALIPEVASRCRAAGLPVRFSSYGGGDPGLLEALRRAGVAVHGYYRAGSLVERLTADRVDAVLIPSTWPEAHSLTLDESITAGLPVIAFDQGALSERLAAGGGSLVDLAAGAAGLADRLSELAGGARVAAAPFSVPSPTQAADLLAALYAELD